MIQSLRVIIVNIIHVLRLLINTGIAYECRLLGAVVSLMVIR